MIATHDNVIEKLNDLIEVCKDGENGYQTAANCVTNADLKSLFQSYARQRGTYASELQAEVMRLGGEPEKHGNFAGPMWRTWTNVKSLLSGGSEHAVISACERGEDAAQASYQDALKTSLPPHIHALIERQLAGIREAHERVRALELATAK
jgi:uncharacterized protein (TIGR02284 family)